MESAGPRPTLTRPRYPEAMARQDPPKNAQQEAEFLRKMVLGILGTLETKGLLSQAEVDSIIRAARQGAVTPAPPRRPGPALPGTHWVNAEGQPLGMDRTTPIAIPNVQRQGEPPKADPETTEGKLPVIDMTME